MTGPNRMSAMTALFLGVFGVGGVAISGLTGITLYGMRIIDRNVSVITTVVENTLSDLPRFVESLPEILEQMPRVANTLAGRRAPEYAGHIDVQLSFVKSSRVDGLRPVMTITNKGSEVVSMLVVRVAALSGDHVPIREWTEVVATPIAVDNEWRGPLFPGKTRHVVISSRRTVPESAADELLGAVEISELRLWQPSDAS